MFIDWIHVWLLFVVLTLAVCAAVCIVLGISPAESSSDSALMPCGHPQSAAQYADDDRDSTGFCRECVRLAAEVRWND